MAIATGVAWHWPAVLATAGPALLLVATILARQPPRGPHVSLA